MPFRYEVGWGGRERIYNYFNITGAATTTAWTGLTEGKWALHNFLIGWSGMAGGELQIREETASGTSNAVLAKFTYAASQGAVTHTFGDIGFPASATNSALRVENTGVGNVYLITVGYRGLP